ncbi:hypothetical protein [Pseudoxanthomonas sp. 10H]|uniref:hypothetical protein n=1 Tax=Pseudoxanthomonas sp. 10H TaxID=3242729 RepID=UPI00355777C5
MGTPALVVAGLGLSACAFERPESSYASLADAGRSGAVEKGWIPAWLPPEAVDIREVHDIDTNESMLAFSYDPRQGWRLSGHCQPVDVARVPSPRFSRRWWPGPDALQASYTFHRCTGDVPYSSAVTWVGRHGAEGHGLHWRTRAR